MHETVIEICEKYGNDRTRLMDILLDIQSTLRGIEPAVMELVARQLGSYRVEVEGMVSFYAFFSDHPMGEVVIRLCDDIVDQYAGQQSIEQLFLSELGIKPGESSTDGRFSLEYTPCIGMCDQAPAALINDTVVTRLTPESTLVIIDQLKRGVSPADLAVLPGDGMNADPRIRSMVCNNIRQVGEVFLGDVPENAGIKRAFGLKPVEVIAEISASGLSGRGGAGFLTGRKWSLAAETPAERRFIICNADEGEPGTFKDRVLLTERAQLLIEGMTIAAYAIQATEGIIYLRGEYRYLHRYLQSVLDERKRTGLLGENISGVAEFNFNIRIQLGAGAYICGEESSLISSCEGLRGEPKNRPPFPVQSGYLGYPTVVNNVETFCAVPRILDRGADWFAAMGTPDSTGTKLLSVSGDCTCPGVYELPFGIRVRELLHRVGAESPAAVLMGGPSGEMINASQFDRRICNEDLPTGGAIVIFSSRRNILEIVEHYMDFFVEESCGYCTPCRVGTVFLKKRINKIRRGWGHQEEIDYLKELGHTVAVTSRCGLGHTAPNPVLSTIKNFPLVYAALLKPDEDGLNAGFDIQHALEESRRLAKRRSMIYDPTYDE